MAHSRLSFAFFSNGNLSVYGYTEKRMPDEAVQPTLNRDTSRSHRVFYVAGSACVCFSCDTAHNMSYDLYFWRQEPECTLSPAEIVERLEEGNTPDIPGLTRLDTARFIARLRNVLPEIYENRTTDPDFPLQLIWEDKDDNAFLVHWSEIHVSIESHGVDGEILNKIIDVALEFDCRLYDPQTDVRYDGG